MECVGTYKGLNIIKTKSAKEYWECTSIEDRYQSNRAYWVEEYLVHKGEVIARFNKKGYLEAVSSPYRFERDYEDDILEDMREVAKYVKAKQAKREETSARGKRAETSVEVMDKAPLDSNFDIDEYLVSKKSVDYFFEEIKNRLPD